MRPLRLRGEGVEMTKMAWDPGSVVLPFGAFRQARFPFSMSLQLDRTKTAVLEHDSAWNECLSASLYLRRKHD